MAQTVSVQAGDFEIALEIDHKIHRVQSHTVPISALSDALERLTYAMVVHNCQGVMSNFRYTPPETQFYYLDVFYYGDELSVTFTCSNPDAILPQLKLAKEKCGVTQFYRVIDGMRTVFAFD